MDLLARCTAIKGLSIKKNKTKDVCHVEGQARAAAQLLGAG